MKKIFLAVIIYCTTLTSNIFSQQSGNYSFLYVSGAGMHGMYFAKKESADKWERGSQIFINGKFDGNAVDPDVIKMINGSYRLYYYKGYFITPPPPGFSTHEIYCAESFDGVNYTNETKVFEYDKITDPSVTILDDSTYLLAAAHGQEIIIAKSSTGLNFTYAGIKIPVGGIPELLKLDNGNIRLFYNGPGGIVSHISTDNGLTWSKENGVRLQTTFFVADPSVIKVGNKYLMFIKGFNNTGAQNPAGHNVKHAESSDAYTFTLINEVLLDSASVPEGIVLPEKTSIKEKDKIPNSIELYQNYPNPFNPSTVISYRLSVYSKVTLKVFDLLGREVATLVDEYKQPGIYNYEWTVDDKEIKSSIYYYRITSGNYSKSKKMLYLK